MKKQEIKKRIDKLGGQEVVAKLMGLSTRQIQRYWSVENDGKYKLNGAAKILFSIISSDDPVNALDQHISECGVKCSD